MSEKKKSDYAAVSDKRLLMRLLKLAKRHFGTLAISSIGVIGAALLNLVTPYVTRLYTSALAEPEILTLQTILFFALALTISYVVRAICRFLSMAISHLAAWRFVPQLTLAAYDKVQALSMRFFQTRQTGELMTRIVEDTRYLENLIAHAVPDLVSNIAVVIGVAVMMFTINVRLALITLIPVPLIVLSGAIYTKKIAPLFKLNRRVVGELNGVLQDNLSGMREIQVFCREEDEHSTMSSNCRYYSKVNIRANFFNALFHPFIELLTSMGTVVVIALGAIMVKNGSMTLSDVVGFVMYISLFYSPLTVLARLVEDVQVSFASGVRVFELLDAEPEIFDEPDAKPIEDVRGSVEFDKVSFYYNEGEDILRDVSFSAKPGEMIALVGPTGVGKTTIVSLLSRMYDPINGRVLIDGQDIRHATLESVRSSMSIVLQDVFLFNGTIAENIAYGALVSRSEPAADCSEPISADGVVSEGGVEESLSDTVWKVRPDDIITGSGGLRVPMEQIIAAAKAACADEFISAMPDGYNTVIGERGVRLSGGQKQRIAIARAILRDTPILILDEATSAVDNETEAAIQHAIDGLAGKRTVIVIAHRLSTVRKADRIIVLENGRIAESGSHDELLSGNGLYSSLYRLNG